MQTMLCFYCGEFPALLNSTDSRAKRRSCRCLRSVTRQPSYDSRCQDYDLLREFLAVYDSRKMSESKKKKKKKKSLWLPSVANRAALNTCHHHVDPSSCLQTVCSGVGGCVLWLGSRVMRLLVVVFWHQVLRGRS